MVTIAIAVQADGCVPCAEDAAILFDLGVSYATGTGGKTIDAIEAHKWLNIAAAWGHRPAAEARASLASDMTRAEIAAAQRAARRWIAAPSGLPPARPAAAIVESTD
ncbi:hypothetical protein [Sphingosinicella sp. BN140058]|uniref:hypothetical protein n=1 Tax=Sphingosinicella sp. BN140058 TaxID=1892855 RepID=UPI0010134DAC|nr:hypothetical protein [Sphingosinicella sp. BN140058]QAY75699.1 hypothetical protein ETR14_03510 [Sphingosinicella sp. BN140058]